MSGSGFPALTWSLPRTTTKRSIQPINIGELKIKRNDIKLNNKQMITENIRSASDRHDFMVNMMWSCSVREGISNEHINNQPKIFRSQAKRNRYGVKIQTKREFKTFWLIIAAVV